MAGTSPEPLVDSPGEKNLKLLEPHLTPILLKEVREFWFEHLESDKDAILPSMEQAKRWFFGGEEFDAVCVKRFAPALEAIRDSGARSADEILNVAQPSGPLDWLGLILLLGQMPRNCYRGAASKAVFTLFDPIARQATWLALEKGIPDEIPELRWRFAYRNWIYLPLMHSEDMLLHKRAMQLYAGIEKDISDLIASEDDPSDPDECRRKARGVVKERAEAAASFAQMQTSFEKKHLDIIERFGRFPHRNEALGRESTKEEKEYLEKGGETFSSAKKP